MNDFARIAESQLEASLAMLAECIDACPEHRWDSSIAKYTFWQVAYHTLCFVDYRLAHGDAAWHPHPMFHPAGRAELDEEYPSRRFTKPELLAYLAFCLDKLRTTLAAETPESLHSPSGFPGLPFLAPSFTSMACATSSTTPASSALSCGELVLIQDG